ncbi:hypothetical protein SAMN04488558_11215 [Ignavigranum ruoffiae]|uniref:Uncharacterized protein n=1 Tax=Ignavigranum ruoffiae TaxID=89093 RepID=A0A1H9G943_9LACT|nr:hypothetical protein SAMN04488558_11215 [Ignavigranum ruoffiae]
MRKIFNGIRSLEFEDWLRVYLLTQTIVVLLFPLFKAINVIF